MKRFTGMGYVLTVLIALVVTGLMFIVSCGGGGGDSASTGTVSVGMTDAATSDYKAIYVTVQEIAAHKDGEGEGQWTVISTPNKTYNLLDLVNGIQAHLGETTLPVGHYTQLRLKLSDDHDNTKNILGEDHLYGNYFIYKDNSTHELKVPSGMQSGIKIVKGFDITSNQITELLLDFDAARSIVMAGSSGTWLLKPTIKVLRTVECCVIQGNAGQSGVLVSAQKYGAATDNVTAVAATVSAETGAYKLYVEPDNYAIVAYKDNYVAYYTSEKIPAVSAGMTYTVETFGLTAADTGTLSGGVIIDSADSYASATISIRQPATVGGNPEKIEVRSLNVGDGGLYTTVLPILSADTYTLVVSSYGMVDKTIGNISVPTVLNITMP